MDLVGWMENLRQDLRYAVRQLRKNPGYTCFAVVILSLGIGGTTAIFSAVNVLLLRRLPYARPDQLMKVTLVTPRSTNFASSFSSLGPSPFTTNDTVPFVGSVQVTVSVVPRWSMILTLRGASSLVAVMNLVVDVVYGILDPRIKVA